MADRNKIKSVLASHLKGEITSMSDIVERLRINSCRLAHESKDEAEKRRLICELDAANEIERLRNALEWYAKHAAGCRKIPSEGDTSRQALDADGGKLARDALSGLSAPTQADKAAAQHAIMMRVFDWAYLHATEGTAWPDLCTAERAIELAKDRPPTQADADTIKATSRFPEASA